MSACRPTRRRCCSSRWTARPRRSAREADFVERVCREHGGEVERAARRRGARAPLGGPPGRLPALARQQPQHHRRGRHRAAQPRSPTCSPRIEGIAASYEIRSHVRPRRRRQPAPDLPRRPRRRRARWSAPTPPSPRSSAPRIELGGTLSGEHGIGIVQARRICGWELGEGGVELTGASSRAGPPGHPQPRQVHRVAAPAIAATTLPTIRAVAEAVATCIRCGNCQAVCPVYAEVAHASRRGAAARSQLAAGHPERRVPVGRRGGRASWTCALTCTACVDGCPSGVHVDDIVRGAGPGRGAARPAVGRSAPCSAASSGRACCGPRAAAAARLQGAGLRARAPTESLRRACASRTGSRPGARTRRWPRGRSRAAGPRRSGRPPGRARVRPSSPAAWSPTSIRGSGDAAVDVLGAARASTSSRRPRATAAACRSRRTATERRATRAARGSSSTAGGASSARRSWPRARPARARAQALHPAAAGGRRRRWAPRAQRLAARSYDVTSTWSSELHVPAAAGRPGYGDLPRPVPPGARPGRPRAAARALTGVAGRDAGRDARPSRCCGGAGSFLLTHQDLVGWPSAPARPPRSWPPAPRSWPPSCPGCRMQLTDVLGQAGDSRPVVHTVELLAAAGRGVSGEPPRATRRWSRQTARPRVSSSRESSEGRERTSATRFA